jgi:hypothetical protein
MVSTSCNVTKPVSPTILLICYSNGSSFDCSYTISIIRGILTAIQSDIDLALSFGFKETPSFIILNCDGSNLEFLQSAPPFPSLKIVTYENS